MSDADLPVVRLRQRRQATIDRLCRHFASDHIEADELERLIDRAHLAGTAAELEAILADLPAIGPETTVTPPVRPERGVTEGHQVVVALMGGTERRGWWLPARNIYVTAIMGGAVLDFRDAELAPGVTEVWVIALMGGVEIIVPPGVYVDSNGTGIMGGFAHGTRGRFPVDSSTPVLRVNGIAVMGGVEIKERSPGEQLPSGGRSAIRRELGRSRRGMGDADIQERSMDERSAGPSSIL